MDNNVAKNANSVGKSYAYGPVLPDRHHSVAHIPERDVTRVRGEFGECVAAGVKGRHARVSHEQTKEVRHRQGAFAEKKESAVVCCRCLDQCSPRRGRVPRVLLLQQRIYLRHLPLR